MIQSPKIKPDLKPGDFHITIDGINHSAKVYNHEGKLHLPNGLSKLPALAQGAYGPSSWVTGGDTPPGLYELGQLFVSKPSESLYSVWYPFGKYCWDLVELENQENVRGRAGIALHGGGTSAPDPLAPMQVLLPTHGCVRMHNYHLESVILPLTHFKWPLSKFGIWRRRKNRVYLSVTQGADA